MQPTSGVIKLSGIVKTWPDTLDTCSIHFYGNNQAKKNGFETNQFIEIPVWQGCFFFFFFGIVMYHLRWGWGPDVFPNMLDFHPRLSPRGDVLCREPQIGAEFSNRSLQSNIEKGIKGSRWFNMYIYIYYIYIIYIYSSGILCMILP